ncbi:hypothetical protein BDR26DRAFT_946624 [Obelidium mucronatum]|nr:hypothetical protein BDR26DRAFT_946624 [Obelidium mucronatum]
MDHHILFDSDAAVNEVKQATFNHFKLEAMNRADLAKYGVPKLEACFLTAFNGSTQDLSTFQNARELHSRRQNVEPKAKWGVRGDVVWVSCRSYDLSVCKLDFEECEFEEKTRNISIDPKSLAKGSARVAHPCQVQGSVFDLSSLIITEPVKGRAIDLVAKIYKNHSQNTNYVHQSDAQCLWVANQSWVAFLEHARTCADQGQAGAGNILESMDGVSFVDGSVYELEGSYSFPVVFVEACIPGTFTKYQSNAKFGQQTTAAQIMDCFSHYTIGDAGRTSRVAIPVASRAAHGPLATC